MLQKKKVQLAPSKWTAMDTARILKAAGRMEKGRRQDAWGAWGA